MSKNIIESYVCMECGSEFTGNSEFNKHAIECSNSRGGGDRGRIERLLKSKGCTQEYYNERIAQLDNLEN